MSCRRPGDIWSVLDQDGVYTVRWSLETMLASVLNIQFNGYCTDGPQIDGASDQQVYRWGGSLSYLAEVCCVYALGKRDDAFAGIL